MTTKLKVIVIALGALLAFAIGRYTTPTKTVTKTVTVEVEKKTTDDKTNIDQNSHLKTVVTEKEAPDGTKTTTTVTTNDTDTKTHDDDVTTDNTTTNTTSTKTTTTGGSRVNLSFMAGVPISLSNLGPPIFGGMVTKEIIGPINVGAWGLSNATGGISIGLSF